MMVQNIKEHNTALFTKIHLCIFKVKQKLQAVPEGQVGAPGIELQKVNKATLWLFMHHLS